MPEKPAFTRPYPREPGSATLYLVVFPLDPPHPWRYLQVLPESKTYRGAGRARRMPLIPRLFRRNTTSSAPQKTASSIQDSAAPTGTTAGHLTRSTKGLSAMAETLTQAAPAAASTSSAPSQQHAWFAFHTPLHQARRLALRRAHLGKARRRHPGLEGQAHL